MPLELADYERKAKEAVMAFWGNRDKAIKMAAEAGGTHQGERAGVTSGINMDGFLALVIDLVEANGLSADAVHRHRKNLTLPGFFRPTKLWDILIVDKGHLVAAIELKSQVGPSFGNNFNNRTEEAIGTALDLWTAYREGAFGSQPAPFVGWLLLVEDAEKSSRPVKDASPHFSGFDAFRNASYQQRYDILCQRLMQEKLYTSAAVITAPRSSQTTGEYAELSEMTSLKTFVTAFAGHIAAYVARQ